MMMIEPHWTAYLSALLTPTVALLGIYIAYQQWRISHNKLKLDLFDKRWQIYADANDAIVVFLKDGDDSYQHYEKLQRRIMDAQFLCSAETVVLLPRGFHQVFE